MPRILLLLPTTTYRAPDFLAAARRMKVEVVAASEKPNVMADRHPDSLLTLNFRDVTDRRVECGSSTTPILSTQSSRSTMTQPCWRRPSPPRCSLPHNSVASARAARNKYRSVRVASPSWAAVTEIAALTRVNSIPKQPLLRSNYPCVLKPLFLSASRGVIRADDPVSSFRPGNESVRFWRSPKWLSRGGEAANQIMVQDFVPGIEFALEGLLSGGELRVLALFDKPDPLDGPFFEETLYITPSRHPG